MVDLRFSVFIVSGYLLLVLATPVRWYYNGWRDFSYYPSLAIQARVEAELTGIDKALKLLTVLMVMHCFWASVLNPLAVRLHEREQMDREREWRLEQLRLIAEIQREHRERGQRRQ